MKQANFLKRLNFFIVLFVLCSLQATSQNCFPITLLDSVTGCSGNTFALNAIIPANYTATTVSWAPSTNLSANNILNPIATVGNTTTTYTVTINGTTSLSIPNGDFSSTVTNFTTDYIPGPGGAFGPLSIDASYMITNDPNIAHTNFPTFGDHTTGTGNMLVLNGSTIANDDIWCQNIAVAPNTTYTVTVWAANCIASNMPSLQFKINGVNTGVAVTLGAASGIWTPVTAVFTTGPFATTVNICLTDLVLAPSGNDFAIDDFSITSNCTSTDSIKVKSNAANVDFVFQRRLGCTEDTVDFQAVNLNTALPVLGYVWNFGDLGIGVGQSVSHIYSNQATYNVTLIASNGLCADTVTKPVNIVHLFVPGFSIPSDSICLGQSTTTNNYSAGTGLSSQWSMGDGTPLISANSVTYTYTKGGTYFITLYVKDILGCVDSFKRKIYVEQIYPVGVSVSDDTICVGEPIFITDTISSNIPSFLYNFGDNITSTANNPVVAYETDGSKIITLTLGYEVCTSQNVSIPIYVSAMPKVNLGPDTSYCPGITAPFTVVPSVSSSGTYLWSDGKTSNSNTFAEAGKYWLQITNIGGCVASDTIDVKRDCFLNIPNSFTPDNDGLNDFFLPMATLSSGILSYNLDIFNRWGENIFTTTNLNGRGWDGKFGNKPQPMGTYMYQIRVAFKNGTSKSYSGNVALLR
jgi:gliding motility-associated-like protein